MGSLHAEFLKLKRSLSWAVVLVLPIIMVLAGSMSTIAFEGEFNQGWHTLWIRSIGFYGMAIVSVAVAILASLVWRVEHRGGNWDALMSRPVPTAQIILGKVTAITALSAAMQLVFVATVIALGKLAFGLPGMLPVDYLLGSLLVVIATVPVAALQSALSTFFRSFAVPVAIALVLTGASTAALLMGLPAASLTPYAALTQATQIGTVLAAGEGTTFDAPALTPQSVIHLVLVASASTAVITATTSLILNRSDTRT